MKSRLVLAPFKSQQGNESVNLDTLNPTVDSSKLNLFFSKTPTNTNTTNAIEPLCQSEMTPSLLPVTKNSQNSNCFLDTYSQENPQNFASSSFNKTSSLSFSSTASTDSITNTTASSWKDNSNLLYDYFKTPKSSRSALNFSQGHTNMPFNGNVSRSSRMLITMLHSSPSESSLSKIDWLQQQQAKFAPTQLPSQIEPYKLHSFRYPLSEISSNNGSAKRKFHQAFVPEHYMSPHKKVRKSSFIEYSSSGNNEIHNSLVTYPQSSVFQTPGSKAKIILTAPQLSSQKTSPFYIPDESIEPPLSPSEMVWDHKMSDSPLLHENVMLGSPFVDKDGKSPLVSKNVYSSRHQKPYALQHAPFTPFILPEVLPNNQQGPINVEREPAVLPLASAEFDTQYTIQQPFASPVIFRPFQQHVNNDYINDKNNVFNTPASSEISSKPTIMTSSSKRKIDFQIEQKQQVVLNDMTVPPSGSEAPIRFQGVIALGNDDSASTDNDLQNLIRKSKSIGSDGESYQQTESYVVDKRHQDQAIKPYQTQLLPMPTFVENNQNFSTPKKNANLSIVSSPSISSRSSDSLAEKQFEKGLSRSNVLATPETPSQISSFRFDEYLNIYTPSPHNNVAVMFGSANTEDDRNFFDFSTSGYGGLSRFDFESKMRLTTNNKSIATTAGTYMQRRIPSADLFKESALLYQSRMCIDGSRVNGTDLAGEYLDVHVARPMST